jgi:hypothetical protein
MRTTHLTIRHDTIRSGWNEGGAIATARINGQRFERVGNPEGREELETMLLSAWLSHDHDIETPIPYDDRALLDACLAENGLRVERVTDGFVLRNA